MCERVDKRVIERVSLIKERYLHVWKHHKETPLVIKQNFSMQSTIYHFNPNTN
jgi:hypothetical protein